MFFFFIESQSGSLERNTSNLWWTVTQHHSIWVQFDAVDKRLLNVKQHKVKGRIDQLSLRDLLMWQGVCSKFLYQLSSLHMCISKFKEYSSSITGSYCCFLALCFGDYKYTKMKEEKCWLRIKSKVIIMHTAFTPKILLVIPPTICCTVLPVITVCRISIYFN